ncbi:MAG: hypothetical protein JWP97_5670 [Labilithrix sp.]|nr:hypothetical protein [Labilithrix sp.]
MKMPMPMRDRMPTIPCDLSEYARATACLAAPDETPEPPPARSSSSTMFVEVWPTDVLRATGRVIEHAAHLDRTQAIILSLLDGETDVASILGSVDLPDAEVMAVLEGLCARGIARIDQAERMALYV